MNRHIPRNDEDLAGILSEIGVGAPEDLLPEVIRRAMRNFPRPAGEAAGLMDGMGESELLDLLPKPPPRRDSPCTLGMGAYSVDIPSVVPAMADKGEFLTAYTPYQPEISQGTLTAAFEFQSVVVELTGLDCSNAGLYDGASATAEGILMALAATGRKKVLVSRSLNPFYREVISTYLSGRGTELLEIPFDENGLLPPDAAGLISDDAAAVVVAEPNLFGLLEPGIGEIFGEAGRRGAIPIQVTNPLALGLLRTPGENGAEIAACEGNPLGLPLSFGGPYLGILAAAKRHLRRMPGRIVGATRDSEGRRAFVLTLQAREQHIRREKATSNICTNQANAAMRFLLHAAALGPAGLREEAKRVLDATEALKTEARRHGIRVAFDGPSWGEVVLLPERPEAGEDPGGVDGTGEVGTPARPLPGIPLGRYFPDLPFLSRARLVSTVSLKRMRDIKAIIEAFS